MYIVAVISLNNLATNRSDEGEWGRGMANNLWHNFTWCNHIKYGEKGGGWLTKDTTAVPWWLLNILNYKTTKPCVRGNYWNFFIYHKRKPMVRVMILPYWNIILLYTISRLKHALPVHTNGNDRRQGTLSIYMNGMVEG